MTQQGLSGMKTANKGSQRQIQDRTFWLGEIRSKSTAITSEIRRVEADMVRNQEESNTFLMFEKRAETLASEISEIQGELHDYNMLIDRMNMNQELPDIVDDLNALKVKNDREADSLERIFEQKETKETQIEQLEKEIRRQRMLTENRVQDMDPEMREHYSELKRDGLQTMEELTQLQDVLEDLTNKQNALENAMQGDSMKQEAVLLYEKLNDLQLKKEHLEHEEQSNLSPEQEQKELLAKVKSYNQEISSMDRQSNELDDNIQKMQEELQQVEDELEDQESEAVQKYRQIQKREQGMDEFEKNFPETRSQEIEQQSNLGENIVALLEEISKTLTTAANLPSRREVQDLKDDLQFKENEMFKAESTSQSLVTQNADLNHQLNKVEELEEKMETEKQELTERMERMLSEIEKFKNLDKLRSGAETRKKELEHEREELNSRKHECRRRADEMHQEYQEVVRNLEENDTHAQLSNLIKKWQHIEQNNFSLKEYIAARSMDSGAMKGKVMHNLSDINTLLQEIYVKSSLYS
uniref:Intraflagellar transport protein 74 homolog n=1 Tax=Phallusia mammillata TaxID=59560 RepID=A0A6F9DFR7_9ASCI|nr:intraflagellar transport protein 74 homolog [Phallusia mammillata]